MEPKRYANVQQEVVTELLQAGEDPRVYLLQKLLAVCVQELQIPQ